MLHGNGAHQREAQTVARFRSGLIEPREARQHALAVGGGDSGPGVRDTDADPSIDMREPDLDAPRGRRVLDGVIEQIGQGLREQFPVAEDPRASRAFAAKRNAAFFRRRLIELADVADDLAEIELGELAAIRAGLDSRNAKQRVECLE